MVSPAYKHIVEGQTSFLPAKPSQSKLSLCQQDTEMLLETTPILTKSGFL